METLFPVEDHLVSEFRDLTLGTFNRDQLQDLPDRKAQAGLSFSTVDHLRWYLKQVFDMAVAEGFLVRNLAQMLFSLRECQRAATRIMTMEEVKVLFALLDPREQLIARLAVGAGMRSGQIFVS